jgi:hypothetical protein
MSIENVDAVRRCLDGWNRGDVDAWLESAHPVRAYLDPQLALEAVAHSSSTR